MRNDLRAYRNELNQAIDFDRVLDQFAAHTSFSLSRSQIQNALPLQDRYQMQEQLDLVRESIGLFQSGSTLSLHGCHDIEPAVKKAVRQMVLTPQELLEIASFLMACQRVQNTLRDESYEKLVAYSETMQTCKSLMTKIQDCIDMSGSVKDDASALLVQKHQQLVHARQALISRSRDFVKKNASKLMEALTTTIAGRTCVLVKAGEKNAFGGMIHGQSQSGLAFYVEPSSFVSLNNEVQLALSQIEEEKHRICKELSRLTASFEVALLSNLETMTILDCAFAKAHWAIEKDGCVPLIQTQDRSMTLEFARHPLIDVNKVVANTYKLLKDQRVLMITGPNMGGKTVTLKTMGLCVALSHAGFPVCCHRAVLPYYRSVWFDIGDQQSIENNLSTFSSHVSSLAMICSKCDPFSFILLDEIGNGTDPAEGSALAIAILEYLIQKKATIITSTHYNAVKSYGKTHEKILVASMQFDKESLMPTYKYLPGVSGASYAFSIARQYHLDSWILDKAKQIKEETEDSRNKELEKLEKLQNEVVLEKERFEKLIRDAHQLQKEAQETKEKLAHRKEVFEKEYQQRLEELLIKKEQEADALIEKLNQTTMVRPHEKTQLMHDLEALQPETKEKEEKDSFAVGDYVQIQDLNSHGEIIELRKKEAVVLTNGMKMKVKTNRLKKMKRPRVEKTQSKAHSDKTFVRVPLELNIIGCRVEEGLRSMDHYLDQCVAHHIKQVRIIHGMGTGKLRSAVWQDLKKHPMVKEYTSAGPSDGGLGATIVTLK